MRVYKIIGLMSGTSLDGLDLAYCHFYQEKNQWKYIIKQTHSITYTTDFQKRLKNTVKLAPAALLAFHNEFGTWLGEQTSLFIQKHQLSVDFIASHGHTVFHQPEIGLTYQIGSGQHLANAAQHKVICDFRTNDVALGGQGAPLVPIGDQLLFPSYDFCLNLGGFSNFSFQKRTERIAYDISPANMPLNYLCKQIDISYDANGAIARQGTLNTEVFSQLNKLNYYQETYPKSLGYEWFVDQMLPILSNTKDSIPNLLHTVVHHIAQQITNTLQKHTSKTQHTLLITGGGAKNDFLVEILQSYLILFCKVIIPDTQLIDFKEALIFAFMGLLKDKNEVNCLKSVTGAKKNSSSGVIFTPS